MRVETGLFPLLSFLTGVPHLYTCIQEKETREFVLIIFGSAGVTKMGNLGQNYCLLECQVAAFQKH